MRSWDHSALSAGPAKDSQPLVQAGSRMHGQEDPRIRLLLLQQGLYAWTMALDPLGFPSDHIVCSDGWIVEDMRLTVVRWYCCMLPTMDAC